MDKQITSIFSDYEPMDNSSITSKQLENWLKQISSPDRSPKFGCEWTFMSNASSRYEPDEISFAKIKQFENEDNNKENDSLLSNKQFSQPQKEPKNKSYVNAMLALQKKVKTLEDENGFMKNNLSKLNVERNRSVSDSIATEQQLRYKLSILEPKTKKIDTLMEQNKKLREVKDQRGRKLKTNQKKINQLQESEAKLVQQLNKNQQMQSILEGELQKQRKTTHQLQEEVKRLTEKNKQLEEMKEKSTLSILEKYNKSVELTEDFEKQNLRLKKQISGLKKNHVEEIQRMQQKMDKEVNDCRVQFCKLKENFDIRESIIEEKKKEAHYFKTAFEKKDEQYIQLVKSHNKHEKHISESHVIQVPQTLIPIQKPKQNFVQKGEMGEIGEIGENSDHQIQFDESYIPIALPTETKSLGKPSKTKKKQQQFSSSSQKGKKRNSQQQNIEYNNKKKQSQHVSQEQQNERSQEKKSVKHSNKQKRKHHSKENQLNKSRTKSNSEVRKVKKKEKNTDNNNFYLINSSLERQPQHKITFQAEGCDSRQEQQKVTSCYYYSAQPPLPHLSQRTPSYSPQYVEVPEFQNKNNSFSSFDEALLIELQKQLLELYEEQQRLILASNDEYSSQAERGEYIGRLKQLNEQLHLKNQKVCQLKTKL